MFVAYLFWKIECLFLGSLVKTAHNVKGLYADIPWKQIFLERFLQRLVPLFFNYLKFTPLRNTSFKPFCGNCWQVIKI